MILRKLLFLAGFIMAGLFLFGLVGRQTAAQTTVRVPDLPEILEEYVNRDFPAHFFDSSVAGTDNTPSNNVVSNEGATLGRVLFYETELSANNTTSCASCHIQALSFGDAIPTSVGFEGEHTDRNSPALANARFYENGRFFLDERASTLEEQVLMPIQSEVEMGLTLPEIVTKLEAKEYYPELFEDAFGTPDITTERVSFALAQFVRSMVSYESKFDQGFPNFDNFTAEEELGRAVFNSGNARCSTCHETAIQIADRPRNTGLDSTTIDDGAGNATFKVPSLRNIELTAPYMHDGRFDTLEEVVEFYDSEVQGHANLDITMRAFPFILPIPRRLDLDQAEKDGLVAFLKTLTDESFTTSERFSDPFIDVVPTSIQISEVEANNQIADPITAPVLVTTLLLLTSTFSIFYLRKSLSPTKQ